MTEQEAGRLNDQTPNQGRLECPYILSPTTKMPYFPPSYNLCGYR